MKKGIIAVSLLLTGALLITPLSSALSQKEEIIKTPVIVEEVKKEATNKEEKNKEIIESNDKTTQTKLNKEESKVEQEAVKADKQPVKEADKQPVKEEIKKEECTDDTDKEETTGMSKEEAEFILNKYIKEVEKSDLTYTYQGDENTFVAMQQKKIRGYVFLPNAETDLAYLVDKDTGSIYYFHPSGYFELLQ